MTTLWRRVSQWLHGLGGLLCIAIMIGWPSGGSAATQTETSLERRPAWLVDPLEAGPSLPPVGRSLFDFLVTEKTADGSRVYRVPFPFGALLARIEQNLVPDPNFPPLKKVLIPLGRSLQRGAAGQEFFRYPRVVVAVDSQPRLPTARAGLMLKDRLFLGYHEKAGVLEVISYNEAAARFEFQVVKNYVAGGTPRVFYAHRAICSACHQNQAPIFSRTPWDETHANRQIAARLHQAEAPGYGVPLDGGLDIANLVDDSTDRANRLALGQWLWRDACQLEDTVRSVTCRAALLRAVLQYGLSGARGFDVSAEPFQREVQQPLAAQWHDRWPGGLAIPDADIPNRNPLALPPVRLRERVGTSSDLTDPTHVAASLEPLVPRPPASIWRVPNPDDIAAIVPALGSLLAEQDFERLDTYLRLPHLRANTPRHVYLSRCVGRKKTRSPSGQRISFRCIAEGTDPGFATQGRVYLQEGQFVKGSVDRLRFSDRRAGGRFRLVDGHAFDKAIHLSMKNGELSARLTDASAIESLQLNWEEADDGSLTGVGRLTVVDDLNPLWKAVDALRVRTMQGRTDTLSAAPFRRAVVMPALFELLNLPAVQWCCVDAAGMPAPQLDTGSGSSDEALAGLDNVAPGFDAACGACHRTQERFPPNFLAGDEDQVREHLNQCAERLYYRLAMWDLAPERRPKTPMPPVQSLHASGGDPELWRSSSELLQLKAYAANLLHRSGALADPAALLERAYESLRPCMR